MGDVYKDLKQFQKALEYYNLSLAINKESGNPYDIALVQRNIARVQHLIGNNTKAEKLYQESLELARNIDSKALLASILESMALFYAETGRYAKAFQLHMQLDTIQDSIFKEKNQKLFADLQSRYELDQKEKAIKLLNAENYQRTLEAKQYRTTTYFLGFGIFIITGLLVVMIYQYNLRKKAYKKLVQKNKQLAESHGMQKEKAAIHSINLVPVKIKYGNGNGNGNGNGSLEVLEEKLNKCLETEKPYLNSNLTMKTLAAQLETNTHYLSEVINQKFGNNFTSLINEFRVREACRLLVDETNDHLTIESIASQAGFNSKSAFNNAFKSITGLTPSYYKRTARADQ